MVKVDGCYANETVFAEGYPAMGKALNATGRPIVYSCSWPAYLKDVRNWRKRVFTQNSLSTSFPSSSLRVKITIHLASLHHGANRCNTCMSLHLLLLLFPFTSPYIHRVQPDYATISKTCNLWRNYDDIQVQFSLRFSV